MGSRRGFDGFLTGLVLLGTVGGGASWADTIERISVDSAGVQGNGRSEEACLSADGAIVAFRSAASNLVPNDTNTQPDIFVHDRTTGVTERVSVDSAGLEGNAASNEPVLSADGRLVVFQSGASNLVPDDTNSALDVFVHDRMTGATERVSVDSAGVQGDGDSFSTGAGVSADGRIVIFESNATNLVPNDTNATYDIFARDRVTGVTERVSVDSAGVQANDVSTDPTLSVDGRYVAFTSYATNLVANDTNGAPDVFVHDRVTGVTERVSVDSAGGQVAGGSGESAISADGRYVAFHSLSPNLVPGDTNGVRDVFVHDRLTGMTERTSVGTSGVQADAASFGSEAGISGDGRLVLFTTAATNLDAGGTNGGVVDFFVRDRGTGETVCLSVDATGAAADGDSFEGAVSNDGSVIAFESAATNLVPGDTNGANDVFVRTRTLPPTTTTLVPPSTTTTTTASSTTTTTLPAAIDGFILPKRVRLRTNAARPSRSALLAAGIVDTGSQPPRLDTSAMLRVGALAVRVPALTPTGNGRQLRFSSPQLSFVMIPAPSGSSRARFRLRIHRNLTGLIDPDAPLTMRFTDPTLDGLGIVRLAQGRYRLHRLPGTLVAPNLYLFQARAALRGGGGDALRMSVGLATDGGTPSAAPDLTVAFGPTLRLSVASAAFARHGNRFVFEDARTRVVLDYGRETLFVKAAGVDVGTFAEGAQPVRVVVSLGADTRVNDVRMVKRGRRLRY